MADEAKTAKTVGEAIAQVQRELVVPKSKVNKFGGFSYRSLEDITAALKEPCAKAGLVYVMSDKPVVVGERTYICATVSASLADGTGEMVAVTAYAREAASKKGADEAQVTGMASSYARKYALCGLFAIDGQSDPDAMEGPAKQDKQPPQSGKFFAKCRSCGTRYEFVSPQQFEQWRANPNPRCCEHPDWVVE